MADVDEVCQLAVQRFRKELVEDLDMELIALLAKSGRLLGKMSTCSLAEFSSIYSAQADSLAHEIGTYLRRLPRGEHA